MKTKALLFVPGILFSLSVLGQDSTSSQEKNKVIFKNEPEVRATITPAQKANSETTPQFYRDTRLGSSSPLYNTYQKNLNGAGAVTNDPNKGTGGGVPEFVPNASDSLPRTSDTTTIHK